MIYTTLCTWSRAKPRSFPVCRGNSIFFTAPFACFRCWYFSTFPRAIVFFPYGRNPSLKLLAAAIACYLNGILTSFPSNLTVAPVATILLFFMRRNVVFFACNTNPFNSPCFCYRTEITFTGAKNLAWLTMLKGLVASLACVIVHTSPWLMPLKIWCDFMKCLFEKL